MTPLTQQLEDKKKELNEIGCGFTGNVEEDDWYECGVDDYLCDDCEIKKIKLTAEIAILEQAIAEIKKQRESSLTAKEILEEFKDRICKVAFTEDRIKNIGIRITAYEELKQQLNQPKTEHEHENQHI